MKRSKKLMWAEIMPVLQQKVKKKILGSLFIMLSVLCFNIPLAAEAASYGTAAQKEITAKKGKESANKHAGNYSGNWAKPSQSYLYRNADGTYNRVEYIRDYIYSETYTAAFQYKSCKKTKLELPVWGGVYITDDAYYVMMGQENLEEKKGVSEFRLIKYDKEWRKVGSADITDANTTRPFAFGSCRFAQIGGDLYVRTCHVMYKSSDGLNHQASTMFCFRMSDLEVLECDTDIGSGGGYVSHSFNQYLAVKGEKLFACDHGDAYKRGIIAMRIVKVVDEDGDVYMNVNAGNLYPFYGEVGDNYTGATLGGLAVSDTHCIAVGNSVEQTEQGRTSSVRNIYTVTTKASGNFTKAEHTWITSYSPSGDRTACNPMLVQISDQSHCLIWEEEYDREYDRTCYVFLDGTGKKISDIRTVYMPLSDCQPIVCEDRIVWYVTNDGAPTFYSIPTDSTAAPRPVLKTKFTKNGIVYRVTKSGVNKSEVSVTGCKKSQMSDDICLDMVDQDGYRFQVTAIGKNAFKNNKKIRGIEIGSQVKKIGAGAFQGCSNLHEIELDYEKYTGKNIGKKAFFKTGLWDIYVPRKKVKAYKKLLKKRGISSKVKWH